MSARSLEDLPTIENEDAPRKNAKPKGRLAFFGYGFLTGVLSVTVACVMAFSMGAFTMLDSFFHPRPTALVEPEPVLTSAQVAGMIKDASELTSARYIYSGIVDFKEGSIPVITRSAFSMYYTAVCRAGIDNLSHIEPEVTDDQVIITLPPSRILDAHISPSSLRFFDTERAFFHSNDREQVQAGLVEAEKAITSADMTELLILADEQMDNLFRGLLEDSIGNRELVIRHEERVEVTAENAEVDSRGDIRLVP